MVPTGPASSEDDADEAEEGTSFLAPLKSHGRQTGGRKDSSVTLRRASSASYKGPRRRVKDEEDEGPSHAQGKQSKEFSEQGKVKWDVYLEYAKASNIIAVIAYLVMMIAAQAAQVGESTLQLFCFGGIC